MVKKFLFTHQCLNECCNLRSGQYQLNSCSPCKKKIRKKKKKDIVIFWEINGQTNFGHKDSLNAEITEFPEYVFAHGVLLLVKGGSICIWVLEWVKVTILTGHSIKIKHLRLEKRIL